MSKVKSLSQLLTLNKLANNSLEENKEIIERVMDLKFKCGCSKFYYYPMNCQNLLFMGGKKCLNCDEECCDNKLYGGWCPKCIENNYINIIVKKNLNIYGNEPYYIIEVKAKNNNNDEIIIKDNLNFTDLNEGDISLDKFLELFECD